MLQQALILAGGRGTRLGPLTSNVPKPMLPVAGKPFLEHLIRNLCRYGIDRIVLSVGYLADAFESHFGNGRSLGVSITYSRETSLLGTGGGVRHALPLLEDAFLVLNGDTLFDCNFLDLTLLLKPNVLAVLALRHAHNISRYGSVGLDGDMVVEFSEKVQAEEGFINAGVYALTRQAITLLPEGASSLETDLFPTLAAQGTLAARAYRGFFIDIGLPETLNIATHAIPEWQHRPCIFFFSTGLLEKGIGSKNWSENTPWTMDAIEAVKWCNDCGCLAIVITNDAGIAREYIGETESRRHIDRMQSELRRHGAHFDAAYSLPPRTAGQSDTCCVCSSRTPPMSILHQAIQECTIDVSRSVLVIDKPSDFTTGECCGVAKHTYLGGSLLAFVRQFVFERG